MQCLISSGISERHSSKLTPVKNSWFSYNEYRIDKLFKNQPILTNGRKHTLSTRLISRFFAYAITGLALVILAGCATQTSSYGPKVSVAANEQIVTEKFMVPSGDPWFSLFNEVDRFYKDGLTR